MRRILRFAAFALATVLILSASACSAIRKALHDAVYTSAPVSAAPESAEPAPLTPEATPAETPDQLPEESPELVLRPLDFTFNKETLEYSDENLSFTLPEGQNVYSNSTAQYRRSGWTELLVNLRFIDDSGRVYTMLREEDVRDYPRYAIAAYMTEQELVEWIEDSYLDQYDLATEVEVLRYEEVSGTHYEGMLFESISRNREFSEHELLWSVVNDHGVQISISYSWPEGLPHELTLDSIIIK